MKKKLLLLLSLMPNLVFASSSEYFFSIIGAIAMEAFVSIHMSFFVLRPLAAILRPEDGHNCFWKLFWIRVGVLLFCDIFITPGIAMLDFFAVFIGAFIVVPILGAVKKNNPNTDISRVSYIQNTNASNVLLKCKECGAELKVTDKFCTKCGAPFEGDNVVVEAVPSTPFQATDYDKILQLDEKAMLEAFINRAINNCGLDINSKQIPKDMAKRKMIMYIAFLLLVCVYVTMIFFHFPVFSYIIGLIILLILFKKTKDYNLMNYLKKVVKERPSEKVTNIVMNVKESLVEDTTRKALLVGLCIAIVIPLIVFKDPRIIYEENDTGYSVRFYIFGVSNFKTATIPEQYKGKDVTSLRGNTFSNMFFLKKVELPDTITEIRGQAFKNDYSLEKVNIPSNLEYLGGGAFYNCSSLKSIELPDTLTYMGGEIFYKASSLVNVKLSENLEEIRGNSFEECTSLKIIKIPDKVTRIGGHAFYGDSSLESVVFSEESQLKEIGSSAFRLCNNLRTIELPIGVSINERAFKESPTQVYYFGQVKYGSIIDKSQYTRNGFIYVKLGESEYVNSYITSSVTYQTYITYTNVTKKNGSSVFYLKYTDKNGKDTNFELSMDKPYYIINDNLVVEISGEYVFDRTDGVSLNTYYN